MLDETDEAPGVQGIGIPRLVFWVWQDGDGHSPNGMTRDPWFGTYWKVSPPPSSSPPHFSFSSSRSGTCPRSKSPPSTPTAKPSIKRSLFNKKATGKKFPFCSNPRKISPSLLSSEKPKILLWRADKPTIYWRNLLSLLIRKYKIEYTIKILRSQVAKN